MRSVDTPTPHDDREYVSVAETMRLTDLGRTTIYDLIAREKLESRKVGKRRLVVRRSIALLGADDQQ
jgi:predicted DNA-binding transcriptional regulator AlpA